MSRPSLHSPPHVPSARQAVDSLRLNAAQLPLRLSPQLQEVKVQLLTQTGQPPRLGPPSAVALMAGRDRGAELRAGDAPSVEEEFTAQFLFIRSSRERRLGSKAAHWEKTSLNKPHKNQR